MSSPKGNPYADYAVKLELQRRSISSMNQAERRRMACSGAVDVAKRALLAMLGPGAKSASSFVSNSDADKTAAADLVDRYGLDVASSRLGITKSSLKRRIQQAQEKPLSYDEISSTNPSRKYLEKNFKSWRAPILDERTGDVCLDMTSRSGTVKLSVNVALNRATLGT